MNNLILSVFRYQEDAEDAIDELKDAGFNPKDFSIIMKDRELATDLAESTGTRVADSAATGATTGGIVGGLAGLLIGIGAITIPGIGAVLIAGPLVSALGITGTAAATISGALTGVVAGGIIGALVGLGIPREEAEYYERTIKEGGILLAVPTHHDNDKRVKDILERNHAEQIRSVSLAHTR